MITGCAPHDGPTSPAASTGAASAVAVPSRNAGSGHGTATGPSDVAEVRGLLAALPVKGRAPKTGYSRGAFGPSWTDDADVDGGHNGCDTRNDILRRDLTETTLRPGSRGCTVLSGVLADPYTGERIAFHRGRGTSRAVQIDHVVALMDAWQKGAQQLSAQRRRELANDLM